MSKRYLIILLAALIILGCSHIAEYVEPTKETMGLATIEGSTKFYVVTILRTTPIAIDNGSLKYNFIKHSINPTSHHITISYSYSTGAWFPHISHYTVTIVADPNHRYIVRGTLWGKNRVWVEDIDNPRIQWEASEQ